MTIDHPTTPVGRKTPRIRGARLALVRSIIQRNGFVTRRDLEPYLNGRSYRLLDEFKRAGYLRVKERGTLGRQSIPTKFVERKRLKTRRLKEK